MTLTRVVFKVYDLSEFSDADIAEDFEEEVNVALGEVEDNDGKFVSLSESVNVYDQESRHNTAQYAALKSTIIYTIEETEEVVPKLSATGKKKVTEEVYDFVKEKLEDGMTKNEVVELFADDDQQLSRWSVDKIDKTDSFDEYYLD